MEFRTATVEFYGRLLWESTGTSQSDTDLNCNNCNDLNDCVVKDSMKFSLSGAKLSLNSVNSGNSENLRNH